MKAEVYPGKDGWRFRVRAANNETMAVGEAYVRRIDAEGALMALFTGQPVDVTVRNHGREVVAHYTLRPPLAYTKAAEDLVAEVQGDEPELPLSEE